MHNPKHNTRIIDRKQLRALIPYSQQHISRLERVGQFPQRVKLGANRVVWLVSEVEAWIAQKAAQRDDATLVVKPEGVQ